MSNKRHTLTFVTITVFIDTVGFGVIMPVLPLHGSRKVTAMSGDIPMHPTE